jgi:hypothetical protein
VGVAFLLLGIAALLAGVALLYRPELPRRLMGLVSKHDDMAPSPDGEVPD